ncbi:hypothetical protein L226DRAFT_566423 [Lentinus tigrinus ALCF2SS1-7]|uniref:Zn(2)-C6 fungal-type domain-containing protein n=1 Tax=Lentinus tigrinus ALCF2SS1-6 TaxID=1328759 RepID=A0A5C2SQK7_9APHY|nr:hypothetical protein L227DRAFT_606087 [Lentinus tigrinus ALCF2SS1-6]RPD79868.1 hypothetical protein L226DRAFT_566423 [Lentinus tigrinus ALCF2SS1-7]
MQKVVSTFKKRRGQRGQPKHSRGETACVRCASTKTKCCKSPTDPQGRCEKCISKGHECVWPSERAGRACRQCRDAKIRCVHVPQGGQTIGQNGAEHAASDTSPQAGPAYSPPPVAGPVDAAIILNTEVQTVQPHVVSPHPTLHIDTGMNAYDPPGTPPSVASSPRSDYWSIVLSDDSR